MLLLALALRRRPRVAARLARRLLRSARDRARPGPRYVELPEPAYRYAVRISEVTGLPLREVLESRPVRNLARAWERRVRVRLD